MKTSIFWFFLALISLETYAQQSGPEETGLTTKEKNEIRQAKLWQQLHLAHFNEQKTIGQNRSPMADLVPTAGSTQTFYPFVGDFFVDPGGPGGGTTSGAAGNYPNCNCDTFTTLQGVVEIQFSYFNVFSDFDYLIIYDGADTSGPVLYDNSSAGANVGDKTLADMVSSHGSGTFVSTTGYLHFEFHATGTVDRGGWAAAINRTVNLYPECADTFLDTGGNSGNYGFLENIVFKVLPDGFPGEAVTVNFSSFDVETGWDALYVYNGPDASYPLIDSGNPATSSGFPAGGYYGSTIPGPFTSTHASGWLTFVFRSDNVENHGGWDASVSCAPLQPPNITCADDFFDTGGPGGGYWYDEVITTTVAPSAGNKVTVTFSSFDVETDYDALYVYDGPNDSAPLIDSGNPATFSFPAGGYYGTTPPGPFTSTHPSGTLTFVFMSDNVINEDGWEASVSCSPLGISENSIEGFSFYPNPVADMLHLEASNTIEGVEIFNLLGEKIMSLAPGLNTTSINTIGLANGIYLMKTTVNGETETYKIIKH